jgi:hypothetical protein
LEEKMEKREIRKEFKALGFKILRNGAGWSVMVPMTASMLHALGWREKDEEGVSIDALRIWVDNEIVIQEYSWDPIMGWVPGCYYLGNEEDVILNLLRVLRDFQKEPFW